MTIRSIITIQGSRRFGGQNINPPALQYRNFKPIGYPAKKDFEPKKLATPGNFAIDLGNPARFWSRL